ncbi:MBL fold metallo-hydrolase [Methyloversatilis sp.]|uniref:MBL fold metallo-hydrolase n=1 Tax=Methyloversatilis sp. TaxID=2569862 RepID=UPI003F72A6B1
MYFHPIEDPDAGHIGYLLADAGSLDAVIIDPPPRSTELLLALLAERRFRLSHVLRTHVHASQPLNCSALSELTGATLVIADGVGINAACPAKVERAVHGSTLVFGQEVLRVLATPGHTAHCVSYLWRDRLFCGDAFDLGSCADGGDDADAGLLYDSLTCRLFMLPEQTLVFPAHPLRGRRVATLGELRLRSAPLLAGSRDAFITDMTSRRAALLRHARPSPTAKRR